MPAYHQMGHHSENLLFEEGMAGFRGAILSPVNCTIDGAITTVGRCRTELAEGFDLIFDPQLYYPATDRQRLVQWEYFPEDLETANLSAPEWWALLGDRLCVAVERLGVDAVCSPVHVPRTYSDDFYHDAVNVAEDLYRRVPGGVRVIQTALLSMADLATAGRSMTVASILTRTDRAEVYLVAVTDKEPRREHDDTEGLKGLMQVVAALEDAGVRVIVSHCSSDVLLWKHAGATTCATGKYFNLRRFTASRWEEPGGGGGQLPYFAEENLLALLRESDVIRIRKQEMLSEATRRSPFFDAIINCIDTNQPWLGLSWRHYLWWFADFEARMASGTADARSVLQTAESNWKGLEDAEVFMEERRNDGEWIRPWRRAVVEYDKR